MSSLVAEGECLYEILGVQQGATDEAIKKGYKRLALQYHPDRTRAKDGDEADTMFKKIGFAYSILKDEGKKRLYDKTGAYGDAVIDEAGIGEMMRAMFREVTEEEVTGFFANYRGSEEEVADVVDAYRRGKGDFLKIIDMVHFDDHLVEEEDRIAKIVQDKIDAKELKGTKLWESTKPSDAMKQTAAYKKRWAKRLKEYEEVQLSKEKATAEGGAATGGKKKKRKKVDEMSHEEQLREAMQDIMKETYADAFSKLAAKYGCSDEVDGVDDEAFEALKASKKKAAKAGKKPSAKKGAAGRKRTAAEVDDDDESGDDIAVETVSAPPVMKRKVAKKKSTVKAKRVKKN